MRNRAPGRKAVTEQANPFVEMFMDPARVARYSEGPLNYVPGFNDLHRMIVVLMRENAPPFANILVHGAGGGLELDVFARTNPDWSFVGVDPAKPMLDAAAERLEGVMDRIELHHGYIDDAPDGPFDAATSLLTLHFLDAGERQRTMNEIVRRLKRRAPLIVAHSSFPSGHAERKTALSRYRDFAITSGVEADMAQQAMEAVSTLLPNVAPEENMEMMRQAGLKNVTSFYTGFSWHGWIGYA